MSPSAFDLRGRFFGKPRPVQPASPIVVVPMSGNINDEKGLQLAALRQVHLQNRYSLGAPTMRFKVIRRETPGLRAGSWVLLHLSWMPDYVTRRRGLVALAQIVALGDLDCAWRQLLVEVVVPLLEGS